MSDGARARGRLVVAHHHPGRLRVRSRTFERDEALREATERWLGEQPGVRVVRTHPPTGSVLVAYDPAQTDAGELLVAIAARTRLAIVHPAPRGPPTQEVFDALHAVDERIFEFSGGRYGLGLVVPIALGVGSVASFLWSPQHRAPGWANLLYWGVQFFRTLNEDQHARRRRHANDG